MANTHTALHYHIVFTTKNRQPLILPKIEERIWRYLGGIPRENGLVAHKVGGVEDHIHVVLGVPAKTAVSKAVQLLKGGSSKWIHDTFPSLAKFEWRDGYAAFTVSKSLLPRVIQYVADQRGHHQRRGYQEEYRELLERHGITFDERYMWG